MHTVDWDQASNESKIFADVIAERLINLSTAGFEEDAGVFEMQALNKLCQWAGDYHDCNGPFDGRSQYIFSDADYSVFDPNRVQRELAQRIQPKLLDALMFDGVHSLEERIDCLKNRLYELQGNPAFSHSKEYMFQKQLHYQELCEWVGLAVSDLFVDMKYTSSPTQRFKR